MLSSVNGLNLDQVEFEVDFAQIFMFTLSQTITIFNATERNVLGTHCGKRRKC